MPNKTERAFKECLAYYESGEKSFWHNLAKKYKFDSPEELRSWFRREMRSRGIMTKTERAAEERRTSPVRILAFDIETTPIKAWTWGIWKQVIRPSQVMQDWYILSATFKWIANGDSFGTIMTPKEIGTGDDSRVVKYIWDTMNNANIVLAYNGKNFDMPRINTRFAYYGLPPLANPKVIDPIETVRRKFAMTSNSLDYVLKYFGLKQKTHAGEELWFKVMTGDREAIKGMLDYNLNDTSILEELYFKLLPWFDKYPNLTVYKESDDGKCPRCLGDVTPLERPYVTSMGLYDQYRCTNCGGVGRVRKNQVTTKTHPMGMRPTEG